MTSVTASELVTIDEIEDARRIVTPVLRVTPVERSDTVSRLAGRPVLLKNEQLQRTGSFKLRGAYCHIARLDEPTRARGVAAASAGNHAQGVALAAGLLGVRATVFMPESTPFPKVEATRSYGAEVRLTGLVFDDALTAALEFGEKEGAHFVAPFDDRAVIAGQGTLGLELLEQARDAETVVVPVGGGGLIAGVGAALKAHRPGVRVVGVEPVGAASMSAALTAGHPVVLDQVDTMADGLAAKTVSELTLAHTQALADVVVTVTEEEISQALLLLLERAKAVVEPAGATALAAVMAAKVGGRADAPVCVVLSGGNIDPLVLMRVIRYGLSAAGRYLLLRVVLHDRPGELHRLLGRVAAMGLNVLGVEHHRAGVHLPIDLVEVQLTLETRDPAHRDDVIAALRDDGYEVDTG